MAYRKKTLRSMSPVTRKVARLIGEQDSVARRFKNVIPEIQRLELDSKALANARQIYPEKTDYEGLGLGLEPYPRSICPDCWIDYTGSGLDRCTECGRYIAHPEIKRYRK